MRRAAPAMAGLVAGALLVELGCGRSPATDAVSPPAGMVYIPGGTTLIGADDGGADERPPFAASVRPFLLDVSPVTVAQFAAFVEATGYVTSAERTGDGGVYDTTSGKWLLVPGATWRHPLGPRAPAAPLDHPVTQVSWHDASAFARWAGKRLPTEVEWEHAARGARNSRSRYPWGDTLVAGGRHRANTWQGEFPGRNTVADGYLYTSPVGAFGPTDLGLTDVVGNVWQWTEDWFTPYGTAAAPAGPGEKVQRGGSFLCQPDFCHGYRVSARSHSTPDTALFHVGFRCAKDPPAAD